MLDGGGKKREGGSGSKTATRNTSHGVQNRSQGEFMQSSSKMHAGLDEPKSQQCCDCSTKAVPCDPHCLLNVWQNSETAHKKISNELGFLGEGKTPTDLGFLLKGGKEMSGTAFI